MVVPTVSVYSTEPSSSALVPTRPESETATSGTLSGLSVFGPWPGFSVAAGAGDAVGSWPAAGRAVAITNRDAATNAPDARTSGERTGRCSAGSVRRGPCGFKVHSAVTRGPGRTCAD
jgi:hypothetical protein